MFLRKFKTFTVVNNNLNNVEILGISLHLWRNLCMRHLHWTSSSSVRFNTLKQKPKEVSINATNVVKEEDVLKVLGPPDKSELATLSRNLSPTYNFAAYVNQSPTLQKLIQLGVDLSKLEKKANIAEFILRLDFDRDIKVRLQFLHDLGVSPDKLGYVLTKNILICRESIDDLTTRINYLQSKRFTAEMIANIITRNPLWLTTPVKVIDKRLGWLQSNYKLSGDEVRGVVNEFPQIVSFNIETIKLNNFVLEMELGMEPYMLKKMLIKRPRLFTKNQHKLLEAFELVHNVMKVPLDLICAQPDILMQRAHVIKERHKFLESLGRAQYNPKLPGYISLDTLWKCDDADFANNVAKSSLHSYNLFLKTL